MNKLLSIAERISQYAVWVSGTVLLLTCFMIAIEVMLRKGFSVSMGGADEISNYALAMSCSWAFAFALFRKAHIRIDVLYSRMGPTVRFALDIVSLVLFALFMTIVSYYASLVLSTSIARHSVANTPLATPMWIPQSLWLIGLTGFTVSIYLILAGVIYNLLKGHADKAQQLAGVSTLEEEIEEESAAIPSLTSQEGGVS
jgi:TRAP-type mannitol/chloroaromatic compound transport system permease small subunit